MLFGSRSTRSSHRCALNSTQPLARSGKNGRYHGKPTSNGPIRQSNYSTNGGSSMVLGGNRLTTRFQQKRSSNAFTTSLTRTKGKLVLPGHLRLKAYHL